MSLQFCYQKCTQKKCNFIAEQILTILNKPFFIQGEELSITPSIGIAMYPDYGTDVNELMKMLIWLCIVRKQMEKTDLFSSQKK